VSRKPRGGSRIRKPTTVSRPPTRRWKPYTSWRSRSKRRRGSAVVRVCDEDTDYDEGAEWDRARDRQIDRENEVW